jgi:hypothetical protein
MLTPGSPFSSNNHECSACHPAVILSARRALYTVRNTRQGEEWLTRKGSELEGYITQNVTVSG